MKPFSTVVFFCALITLGAKLSVCVQYFGLPGLVDFNIL